MYLRLTVFGGLRVAACIKTPHISTQHSALSTQRQRKQMLRGHEKAISRAPNLTHRSIRRLGGHDYLRINSRDSLKEFTAGILICAVNRHPAEAGELC